MFVSVDARNTLFACGSRNVQRGQRKRKQASLQLASNREDMAWIGLADVELSECSIWRHSGLDKHLSSNVEYMR